MLVILKSKGATSSLCEHFQLVAAKKSQQPLDRVNGPYELVLTTMANVYFSVFWCHKC